ncbi:CarD family transcriptional regulator [Paenibacillus phocaensis]|uniref:CarD family transcriptional regulator n=1 Tax=Paenibacillus phocaensis TaxID=1776378 RepID=UPI000839BFA4|nr:CarD family transcriptional regulator [Paenibacillus phocaensis]
MFAVNEYVIYGSNGVCQIKDICTPPGVEGDRKYYLLNPVYLKGTTIYTPVDNLKVIMRSILSREESERLISRIPSIDATWISNDKAREASCKQAINTGDHVEWIKVIKTMRQRKTEQNSLGKKLRQSDERLLCSAAENLHGELAVSLNIPKEEVEEYIQNRIGPSK